MSDVVQILKTYVEEHSTGVLTVTGIPRLDILRVARRTDLFPEIYPPLISLILQGEKQLLIGDEVIGYSAGDTFIASVELPVTGEITEASVKAPYLAMRLVFDPTVVADLVRDDASTTRNAEPRSFRVSRADDRLVDAWARLVDLMERPDEIAIMAPLLEREILFRLLRGPQGDVLRQVASIDSRFSQMRNVLSWIRTNYATAFQIDELARLANMSPSAFHRRFKASTGLSPLQYQKRIRLFEARRMLFAKPGDVAAVALAVGYESLSQFSREYVRVFGTPPARDIRSLSRESFETLSFSADFQSEQ